MSTNDLTLVTYVNIMTAQIVNMQKGAKHESNSKNSGQ